MEAVRQDSNLGVLRSHYWIVLLGFIASAIMTAAL
jgi:hypothetical protein